MNKEKASQGEVDEERKGNRRSYLGSRSTGVEHDSREGWGGWVDLTKSSQIDTGKQSR